ncbi:MULTISPECIES: hypothetical protein [Serratia]|uniref:hypothetical protein n=1 Tax=Serratia TaxID=613 RepID=UPI0027627B37|nr:hypothetical protein [Serratia marcescens]MDP8624886.1 hypothetical protein [Serratia marcescens]MDP8674317.1 hypothetical protein [Serratia marcescens]MDP8689319.1 hypothetical protein [Serratia marcescens]MDP8699066.1 hypothetical protein [Serratia marcescens]MDP8708744.1 hypothetical protein [Serratia marcescens]
MDKFNYLKEQLTAALATWQQTNGGKTTVGWMHAANPEVIAPLLAELEAKNERIIGLERHVKDIEATLMVAADEVADLTKERDEARAQLATPVRLLGEMLPHEWERAERQAAFEHRKIAWDARLAEDKKAILAAGFTFTVEGDE